MTERVLHLLRHGAPETPGLLMGRTDGMPTPAGIAACLQRTGLERTGGIAFDAIVTSDLKRTRRAAAAIGAARQLAPAIDPRWRELDFGDWDGLPSSAVDRSALAAFWDDPDAWPPPSGERWSDLVARVAAAVAALDAPSTLVVTHGGAMRAALAHLCGFAQAQLWAFDLPYTALLTLKVWPGDQPCAQVIGLRA